MGSMDVSFVTDLTVLAHIVEITFFLCWQVMVKHVHCLALTYKILKLWLTTLVLTKGHMLQRHQ